MAKPVISGINILLCWAGFFLLVFSCSCRSTGHEVYPLPPREVTDADGNRYPTLVIGSQAWLAGNLRTTRYVNGDSIPMAPDDTTWIGSRTGAWCLYQGQVSTDEPYGVLYNGNVITDKRGVCPAGWHIPDEEDWLVLTAYLGGETHAGIRLKEDGTSHWAPPNDGSNNSSGFTALPAGYRNDEGVYGNRHFSTIYWSSDSFDPYHLWYHYLYYNYQGMYKDYFHDIRHGFSIRCIWDKSAGPGEP